MSEFVVKVNNNKYTLKLIDEGKVEINGKTFLVNFLKVNNQAYLLKCKNKTYETTCNKISNNRYGLVINGWYFETNLYTKLQEKINEISLLKNKETNKTNIKAPMPGMILKFMKHKGDEIKIGDPIFILEAMKMENEIRATGDGIIKEVYCNEGEPVEKDTVVLSIE